MGNNTISIARNEILAAIQHIGMNRIRAFERTFEHDQGQISTPTVDIIQWETKQTTMLAGHALLDWLLRITLLNFW
jgi:hypothetical protein